MEWQPIATFDKADGDLVDLWFAIPSYPPSPAPPVPNGVYDSFRTMDCWKTEGKWFSKDGGLHTPYITHWLAIPEIDEGGMAPTNIDYLKLAKLLFETLRNDKSTNRDEEEIQTAPFIFRARARLLEEATLAIQIAQVEATRAVANGCWAEEPFPSEEDAGEDCIHGLNVRSEIRCTECSFIASLDD